MFVPIKDSATAFLEDLNDEQRAAVTHCEGPLLVLAGAGTGKTTTLVSRMAWLVAEQGVSPEQVLLLTFTRRAARQMLERARVLLGAGGSGQVVGGTFHSVAHRLLRLHPASVGLPPEFGVLDASDAADLLEVLREERGLAEQGSRFPRKATLLDIYSRCVNAQRPLSQILAEAHPQWEDQGEALGGLFAAYGARKHALGVLDLDDLLLLWRALARHEVVGPQLGRMFAHVLVDEYQDLNQLQVDIVAGLRSKERGLTVVGDDAQVIYGFRSASAEHILNFRIEYPDATVVTLEHNYRSSQPILDLANEVAAGAARAYPKRLRADREGGSRPQLVFCLDQSAQTQEVCQRILDAYEQGTELKEQAVLMRAGHHSDQLELELTRRKIPFVKYGGIRYLDAAHVKDFLCLLRLANNPGDQLAWFRTLQLLEGVGPVTARRALDALDLDTLDSTAELADRWLTAEPLLKKPAQEGAVRLIAGLVWSAGQPAVGVLVERLRDAIAPLIRNHYRDGTTRLRDLDQLTRVAADAHSLSVFLAELAIDPPSSSADLAGPPELDDDYLILSTVHSAKGLEWDAVHLIAASDGNFPSDKALTSPEGLEEERRLFYVALTRARHNLTIHIPRRYYHQPHSRTDSHGYGNQSRFLTDEAEALCDRTDLAPDPHVWSSDNVLAADTVTVDLTHLWH